MKIVRKLCLKKVEGLNKKLLKPTVWEPYRHEMMKFNDFPFFDFIAKLGEADSLADLKIVLNNIFLAFTERLQVSFILNLLTSGYNSDDILNKSSYVCIMF